jgi:hypothetical protein
MAEWGSSGRQPKSRGTAFAALRADLGLLVRTEPSFSRRRPGDLDRRRYPPGSTRADR